MKINSFSDDHDYLSNFFYSDVVYEGILYPSIENAFQAAKTLSVEERRQFVSRLPGQAKRLGRKIKLRPDWEEIKIQVMTDLVRYKFNVHADLKQKLLATGDAELVEGNTWHDTFWGVCDGVGRNELGKILMQARAEFQRQQKEA
jgi:ribA/ribD-fused uncharacterized protein